MEESLPKLIHSFMHSPKPLLSSILVEWDCSKVIIKSSNIHKDYGVKKNANFYQDGAWLNVIKCLKLDYS
jgi:hypothetical protein